MNGEKKKYTMTIFGDQYVLVSDEAQEHVMKITMFVDSLMQEIAQATKLSDAKKVAVLAALQIADKFIALEAEAEKKKLWQERLISQIDQEFSSTLHS